ncbi:putative dynein light chain 1, cytoplasmic-like [Cocos nucifera]|nr:putative dynein light chain 1, cytoplasmic-like [Cocos nucifera]
MAEESKKDGAKSAGSVAYLRASSDDRKPSAPLAGTEPGAAVARKITFKSADMKEEMQQEVFECARIAFDKDTVEKGIAEYIKKEFDKKHGPTWHCIVGRNFVKSFGLEGVTWHHIRRMGHMRSLVNLLGPSPSCLSSSFGVNIASFGKEAKLHLKASLSSIFASSFKHVKASLCLEGSNGIEISC